MLTWAPPLCAVCIIVWQLPLCAWGASCCMAAVDAFLCAFCACMAVMCESLAPIRDPPSCAVRAACPETVDLATRLRCRLQAHLRRSAAWRACWLLHCRPAAHAPMQAPTAPRLSTPSSSTRWMCWGCGCSLSTATDRGPLRCTTGGDLGLAVLPAGVALCDNRRRFAGLGSCCVASRLAVCKRCCWTGRLALYKTCCWVAAPKCCPARQAGGCSRVAVGRVQAGPSMLQCSGAAVAALGSTPLGASCAPHTTQAFYAPLCCTFHPLAGMAAASQTMPWWQLKRSIRS